MLYTEQLANELKSQLTNIVIEIKEEKEWTFDVIATTEDVDRDNEILKVNGWDIKNWLKNPIILANHHYIIENIIWKGISFYTSDWVKRLKGVFSKTNPLWVLAKNLYQEWMLKSVSVGFIPTKRNEVDFKIIEEAELLEISFVAVPCNPNAVSIDWKLYAEWIAKWFLVEEKCMGCDKKEEVIEEVIEEVVPVTLETLNESVEEIKSILKTMADDKVKASDIVEQEEEAKAKKEFLQNINKATAIALENLKKL